MKDTCQLNDFLKGLKPEYGKLIASFGKRIMFLLDEKNLLPNISVEIDKDSIRKILDALVDNSAKYTEKGYIKLGYRVLESDVLQFFVEDTGLGIDAATLEKLNDKLSRTVAAVVTDVRNLTEASQLAKTINGKIKIESQKDMGTTVYLSVNLPTISLNQNEEKQEKTGILPESSRKHKQDAKQDVWRGKTILIVEDELVNYLFLEVLLEETGAILIHASDGQQAINFAKNTPEINLILMDIKMPNVNGLDATKEIKSFRPQVPVIAQTAYAMQDDEYKALQAGCNEYISKPIDANKLIGMMQKYLIPR
ncbi:MAG: response regulator [Bacteroidales bacterium]|jgi:CheY-like chemotaxis protein|nr:response regulator [Bacteroidales bacterium]